MKPLGDKILVRDIVEVEKKTASGILLDTVKEHYKKVTIVELSDDTETNLQVGNTCLSDRGGVEIENGLWLCSEKLLVCKL